MRNITRGLSLFVVVIMAALLVACGGGGGGSASSGTTALASGSFTKTTQTTITYDLGLFASGYNHWQNLYLASEVNATGTMTGISIRYGQALTSSVTCPNVTIKLSHSNLTSLGATLASNLGTGQGGQTMVLNNASVTFPAGAAGSWHTIKFSTPFKYDGIDNLIADYEVASSCTALVSPGAYGTSGNQIVWSLSSSSGTGNLYAMSANAQFLFSGGDDLALAADRAGNNGNNIAPASTGHSQYLILASDIDGKGPITGIQFQAYTPPSSTVSATYAITLSLVPATTIQLASTTFSANTGTHPTVVASGVSVTLPVGTSQWWVPLSGSFNYDGTSNLLIDVTATVTNGFPVAYQTIATSRILSSTSTTSPTGVFANRGLEPRLRFNGGQVVVVPPAAGNTSAQILGSGSAGQVQSLYRNDELGTSGTIQDVYVRLAGTPAAGSLTNYKLYMGHTSKTTYNVADTYASNMNENALVMSGTLTVPAGLQKGDWVKIPLSSPFTYDSSKNLSILFTTDAGPSGNTVSIRNDSNQFPNNMVGRNDNAVSSTGTPTWTYNGIVDLKIDLTK